MLKNDTSFKFQLTINFIFFISFLLVGCTKKSDNSNFIITVEINDNDDKITEEQFHKFFKYDRYIIPELSDNSILGEINKVYLINDTLYVMHDKNQISSFNSEGKFLHAYSHLGQGPGEYSYINDIDIKEGIIYILSRNKIYKYSINDDFIGSIDLDNAAIGLCLYKDGIVLNNGFGLGSNATLENYSYTYKGESEILKGIEFNPLMRGHSYSINGSSSRFIETNDELFTYFPYNDTIYKVDTTGRLFPSFEIKIKNHNRNINKESTEQEIKSIMNSNEFTLFEAPYKWNDFFLFGYSTNLIPKLALISLKGEVIINGRIGFDSNNLPVSFVPLHSNKYEDYILNIIPSEVLKIIASKKENLKDYPLLMDLDQKLNENSNPVFVFYKTNFYQKKQENTIK